MSLESLSTKFAIMRSEKGNFEKVTKVLEQIPEGGIVKEIIDPVEWQRQQRDEWSTHELVF